MSNPEQTHGGGQPGNHNARRSGWTSRLDPAPVAEILAAADTAVSAILPGADPETIAAAFATLRRAERALRFRHEHAAALIVRQSIDLARETLREDNPRTSNPEPRTSNVFYAPESVSSASSSPPSQIPAEAPRWPDDPPANGGSPLGSTESQPSLRIAYGRHPGSGQGTFPTNKSGI